jgi:lipid II:glycine glycyltransferase (peptidoglycan interpeptide bridge formation enzyme)
LNALTAATTVHAEISTMDVTSREHWNKLFAEAAAPHFTQSWCYGEGKRMPGWSVERLAFEGSEGTVAICQVLVWRIVGVPVVARINRGPLFMMRSPPGETQFAVFRALRRRWRFGRRGLLLIAPALADSGASYSVLRGAGFFRRRAAGWGSSLIDLQPSLETIRASLSSKWRNHLNTALKAGIGVSVRKDAAAVEWMLQRHAANMARKGFAGPAVDFVQRMNAASPEDFWVFQAQLGVEPVCGILVARFGSQAETFLSWTGDSGRRANAHHLLLWHVLVEMKAAGCRMLDLGGFTTTEKYGAYKRGMKGTEYRLSGEWFAF